MAGALGDLVIALHADIAKFTSDMGRAAHISEREWRKVAGHAESAGRAIAAGALIAGAAAIKMGADFINAAADLDDMAEKTGASVEELSKLEQQARISGTAIETVETGLVRLARSLHENDEEAKKATKALDALGLKAVDLKDKDTATALQIVAGELNKYADGSSKAALAMDLFGKSGAQLLPFLKDMANDGELNARVTAKQAADAEELGKSWRRLVNDARGVGQALALDVVPWLQRSINEFREGIKIAGSFGEALRLLGSINPFRTTGESVANLTRTLESFKEARAEALGRDADTSSIDEQIRRFEKQLEFAKFRQRQDALALGGADTAGERQRFGLAGQKLPLDYASVARGGRGGKNEMDAAAREAERAMRDQISQTRRLQEADLRAFQHYKDEIRRISDEVTERQYYENIFGAGAVGLSTEDLKRKLDSTIQGADALREGWDEAARAAAGFDENGRRIVETTKDADDLAKSLGLTFSSAFEDAVIGGKKLRDVLQGIAQDIARMIIRESVTKPAATFIGSILNKGIAAVFGGGGSESEIATAEGGWRRGGQPLRVGERGPELFVPASDGFVVPNDQLRALSAGGPTFVIDARGADVAAVQRLERIVRDMNGSFERRTIDTVDMAMQRGRLRR